MKYVCFPNDPAKFSTHLTYNKRTNRLNWDSASGQDSLIIQTPFGTDAVPLMNDICHKLEHLQVQTGRFFEVAFETHVMFVTSSEKAANSGCVLNGEACRYTVLSYEISDGTCKLYLPKEQTMISPYIDIPLEVCVDISKGTALRGLIKKREVDLGYYIISFPPSLSDAFVEGSLSIIVDNIEIPVTKALIENGTAYVYSPNRPEPLPKTRGLRLISS